MTALLKQRKRQIHGPDFFEFDTGKLGQRPGGFRFEGHVQAQVFALHGVTHVADDAEA